MIVRLCQSQLARMGAPGAELVAALRDKGHLPAPQACLNICGPCEKGPIAIVDGMPLGAPDVARLLEKVEALAADE